jgi:tRNA dimethylallyltransferase
LTVPLDRQRVLVLAGPTAVGKTSLSIDLAAALDAEIVSADSRQVYRQLTIGTAKPSPEELATVRHHFIDELDLGEPFSAGRFAAAASERSRQIRQRGRLAIVTGGSTLYLEALVHGLDEVPTTSSETRRMLTARLAAEGPAALFAELERVDPASAAIMDPSKSQRLVRALEVFHETGTPLSHYHGSARAPVEALVIVLDRPRAVLYERINRRVEEMLAGGLLEENRALMAAGFPDDLNALRTIGYREPRAFLRGEVDEPEMVRRLKQNTRRYAKRQLTWFRRRLEYRWLDLEDAGDRAAGVVAELWRAFSDRDG